MRISTITAVGLLFAAATAQAATNSWKYGGSDFWDVTSDWSLPHAPNRTDSADFITNAVTKLIKIDDTDSGSAVLTNTLTISNLTVGATGSTTNSLLLTNMTEGIFGLPLEVFNGLTVTNGGLLEIVNSTLLVDGASGGSFNISGTMQIDDAASVQANAITIATNAVLQFSLGTNSIPVAATGNLTVGGTLNVIDGGGFTSTTYTLFTYGGTLTNVGTTVGTTPLNSTCVIDTNTFGQVNLVVSIPTPPTFQITSIVRQSNDILISWSTTGAGTTNILQVTSGAADGGYATNSFASLSGNMFITGATTNYIDTGGATNGPTRFYRVRLVP